MDTKLFPERDPFQEIIIYRKDKNQQRKEIVILNRR